MARPGLMSAHRLAARLGRADVDGLLASMTARQLNRWRVFDALDAEADDHRFGVVAATLANYAGKVRADGSPLLTAEDFFPRLARPRKPDRSAANKSRLWFAMRAKKKGG